MLSLRSLAFILASAMRRARALSCSALDSAVKAIRGRKMATKIAPKMATKIGGACMVLSYEKFTPSRLGRDILPLSSLKIQSRRFRTLPDFRWRSTSALRSPGLGLLERIRVHSTFWSGHRYRNGLCISVGRISMVTS